MNINFNKLGESEKETYSKICEMPEFKSAGPILHKIIERMCENVLNEDNLAIADETNMGALEKFYSRITGEQYRANLVTTVNIEISSYLEENGNTVNMDDIMGDLSELNRIALSLLDEIANKILRKEIDMDKGFDELDTDVKWDIGKAYRVLTASEYSIINAILGSKLENAKTL